MVLNTRTRRVTITNFCLGKHLIGDRDLLRDQRGSPAYISPDVLSGMFCMCTSGGGVRHHSSSSSSSSSSYSSSSQGC